MSGARRRPVVRPSSEGAPDFPHGVGRPAQRALVAAGYRRLEELADASERELSALHGMGPKALQVVRAALAARGLRLRA